MSWARRTVLRWISFFREWDVHVEKNRHPVKMETIIDVLYHKDYVQTLEASDDLSK